MCEERTRRPNNAAPNERSGLSEWSAGWIAGGFVHWRRSRTGDTAEAVEAKQDGLGGVVAILTGEEGILGERREFACAAA